jgi:hypothetical protein
MADPVAAGGVAGALAAVSAPLTKLVETVSAGLGRVYEPTHHRRMAKAEGDRMVILATAANEVTDIERRAVERWLAVETARQQNIESIADKAQSELPPSVESGPVDPGWTARFFDSCKDVSDGEMQALWARLLASEVAAPGANSLRAMSVLSNLSPAEAALFSKLCALTVTSFNSPFLLPKFRDAFDQRGLDLNARRCLESAGLVHRQDVRYGGHPGMLILEPLDSGPVLVGLHAVPTVPVGFELGEITLTPAGAEIARLWKGEFDPTHATALVQHFRAEGWQMEALPWKRMDADRFMPHGDMPQFLAEYLAKRDGVQPAAQ